MYIYSDKADCTIQFGPTPVRKARLQSQVRRQQKKYTSRPAHKQQTSKIMHNLWCHNRENTPLVHEDNT